MTFPRRLSRTGKLAAVGAAAGALLATTPGGAAAATATTERTHVDFGTFVEQSAPCTGEPVQWTGGYDLTITTVTGESSTVRSLQYVQQLTGVGLTSGSSYVLNANYHETVKGGDLGAAIFIMPTVYIQVSKDGQPNYAVHEIRRQVIAPDGTVVVDADDFAPITCVG